MPYYYAKPDTAEDIRLKISSLTQSTETLKISLSKMEKDLLKNHLTYSDHIIKRKKTMMEQTKRLIQRQIQAIDKYEIKLKTLDIKP